MDMATPDAVSAGLVQGSKRLLQAQLDALQVIRDLAANFRGVLGLAPEASLPPVSVEKTSAKLCVRVKPPSLAKERRIPSSSDACTKADESQ
jgi:hypothetical protein